MAQVMDEGPYSVGHRCFRGIELCTICRRIEQPVSDAVFLAAVSQIVVVAVGGTVDRQCLIRQVVLLTVVSFVEQPVCRCVMEEAQAIGIEAGLRAAIAYCRRCVGMLPHVPCLV